MKRTFALSLVIVTALVLLLLNLTSVGAAEENVTLLANSYTTTNGGDGGQPVDNLHVLDQGNWNTYVEFTTPGGTNYKGYRTYVLPGSIDPANITGMEVKVSWKGPLKSYQAWTWKIRDFANSKWVTIGNNAAAPDWKWWVTTFTVSGNFANYVNASGKIKIRLQSGNAKDNCDLDYEHVKVYYTSGPAPTDTPVPPTDTPAPPTNTPTPAPPTDTPVPPTDTPIPPTDTPAPPTNTPTPVPPTNTPPPGGSVIAEDDFESGDWNGGSGWMGSWTSSGTTDVVTNGTAHGGSYHLRLRKADGVATREVYLQGSSNVRLQFWWKANSFESGETGVVKVYDGSWHTVLTVNNGEDDNVYHYADIDLSAYNMVGDFQVQAESHMSGNQDYFYIDDLQLVGNPGPTPTPTPIPPTPTPGGIWQPSGITPWQWQLTNPPVDQSYDVDMYDIDLFDNDASVVSSLHSAGRVVIAYFSAGSWEDWRPDADDFPESVKCGNNGWPGEKWLDIRQIDTLGPLMEARMDLAVQKGFDGVEPDNVDGYDNNNGCSGTITYQDQIDYNTFLANAAHARNLSVCLKNDVAQVADLEPYFDWALNEECYRYSECDTELPFTNAGKAVMHVEYNKDTSQFCPWDNSHDFSGIKKNLDLDAWMDPCW